MNFMYKNAYNIISFNRDCSDLIDVLIWDEILFSMQEDVIILQMFS